MKLKVLLLGAVICSLPFSLPLHAKIFDNQTKNPGYQMPKTPQYGSGYGNTHDVKPYFKKDGTYVEGHKSGNPRSGVHCHNNICY